MGLRFHHKKILKIGVSLILLGYLVHEIPLEKIVALYGNVSLTGLIGVCLLFLFLTNVVCPYRWRLILRSRGVHIPFRLLSRTYLEAMFFSMFTPAGVGGDLYRIKRVADLGGDGVNGAASVLVDRYTGLIALILIGLSGSFFYIPSFSWGGSIPLIYAGLLLTGLSPFLLFREAVRERKGTIGRIKLISKIKIRLNELYYSLRACFASQKVLGRVIVVSWVYQLTSVYAVYLMGNLLGTSVDAAGFFYIVPLIYLLIMLPVSLNGIGVREASFAFFLSAMGDEPAVGLGLSLLLYFFTLLNGLLGGVFYLVGGTVAKSRSNSGSRGSGIPENPLL